MSRSILALKPKPLTRTQARNRARKRALQEAHDLIHRLLLPNVAKTHVDAIAFLKLRRPDLHRKVQQAWNNQ